MELGLLLMGVGGENRRVPPVLVIFISATKKTVTDTENNVFLLVEMTNFKLWTQATWV